jgi:hypothetical protein
MSPNPALLLRSLNSVVLPLLLVWRICVAGQAPKKTSKVKAVAVLCFHRGREMETRGVVPVHRA